MNRRTFLRAAGLCSGGSVAGCLDTDNEAESNANGNTAYPRHDRPAYSEWPPAESYDGGGVLFAQLRLRQYPAVRQAIEAGRLDTSQPVVGLSIYGSEQIATAVETLSTYPFGDALQQAVITAISPDGETVPEDNQTLVEPTDEPLSSTHNLSDTTESHPESTASDQTGNESTAIGSSETETTDTNPASNETDDIEMDSNETVDTESDGNETVDTESDGNETVDTEDDEPISAADVGIELDRIALLDEVLVFEGSFNRPAIIDRFGDAFEHVDTHRGVSIYEGSDEMAGFAFALDDSRLVVPTAVDDRSADGEAVLAHSVSGYISTLNRIVDTADGQWLFETTGPTALSVGVWETPLTDHLNASDVDTNRPAVEAVFGSVDSCLSAIAVTDETDLEPAFEARFSGLYSDGPPTDSDFESVLVDDDADLQEFYIESPRVLLTTAIGDQ